MKKFMVLYMMPAETMADMMKTMTPEAQKASMDEWNTWMESHASDFADKGAPLGKNKRVSASGVEDIRNEVGGYSIVQAESYEDAVKLVQSSPHAGMGGMYTEVMEIVQM